MKNLSIFSKGVLIGFMMVCIGLFFNKIQVATVGSITVLIAAILYVISAFVQATKSFTDPKDSWF